MWFHFQLTASHASEYFPSPKRPLPGPNELNELNVSNDWRAFQNSKVRCKPRLVAWPLRLQLVLLGSVRVDLSKSPGRYTTTNDDKVTKNKISKLQWNASLAELNNSWKMSFIMAFLHCSSCQSPFTTHPHSQDHLSSDISSSPKAKPERRFQDGHILKLESCNLVPINTERNSRMSSVATILLNCHSVNSSPCSLS